jgi:protein-L-isoaspartate(D-aspartate) O-methyltransferase
MDRVARAATAVQWRDWAFDRYGRQIPQTTRPELVQLMVRLLAVPARATILEIGTGSGYSTALLAALVGSGGHVVTLDIDPQVVFRVRRLVRKRGIANVTVLRGDGRRGYPTIVFDRIISWASLPSCCPDDWISQLRPGGVVVLPIRGPGDNYAVRMRLGRGRWHEDQRIPASFVPMTPVPFRPWEAEHNTPVPQ